MSTSTSVFRSFLSVYTAAFKRFGVMAAIGLVAASCTTATPTMRTPTKSQPIGAAQVKLDAYFQELVSEVLQQTAPVDFHKIRKVYILTSLYTPYFGSERAASELMFKQIKDGQWSKCLDQAENILRDNFISLSGHFGSVICHDEIGNVEKRAFHKFVLDGLIQAIHHSGDGKSTESAFFCTSTNELYDFTQLHGLTAINQSLINKDGQAFDHMTIKDPNDGSELSWYFNITAQVAHGFEELN